MSSIIIKLRVEKIWRGHQKKLVLSIHEIQTAKKPATIAMIAATPPFATKEPAADDDEAAAGDAPVVEAPPVGLGVNPL